MIQHTLVRLSCALVAVSLSASLIGYGVIKNAYPERQYSERFFGLFMVAMVPAALIGTIVGLVVAERLLQRRSTLRLSPQQEDAYLLGIAQRRLANPNTPTDEATAWQTLYGQLVSQEDPHG